MGLKEVAITALGTVVGLQVGLVLAHRRQPRPFPHQGIALLEHPWRLGYLQPATALDAFGLEAGMTILEIGCGSGVFTPEIARRAGPRGVVHAVDIQPAMIESTRQRLTALRNQDAGLAQVRFHTSGAYQLPLTGESVDLVLLMSVLGEIPDPVRALTEVRRVLKPGCRLALGDELLNPAYLSAPAARTLLHQTGFRFGGQERSPFHYTAVYFKNE